MSVVAQNEAFHKYVKPFFTHASLCNLKGKIKKNGDNFTILLLLLPNWLLWTVLSNKLYYFSEMFHLMKNEMISVLR